MLSPSGWHWNVSLQSQEFVLNIEGGIEPTRRLPSLLLIIQCVKRVEAKCYDGSRHSWGSWCNRHQYENDCETCGTQDRSTWVVHSRSQRMLLLPPLYHHEKIRWWTPNDPSYTSTGMQPKHRNYHVKHQCFGGRSYAQGREKECRKYPDPICTSYLTQSIGFRGFDFVTTLGTDQQASFSPF